MAQQYEETYENSGNCIKCPYCQAEINNMHEYDFNDDSIVIDCDCGKKFYVSEYKSVSYTGKPNCELNKEEHQFEPHVLEPKLSKCKICGELKYDTS